jgi:hypothetical protein
MAPAAWDPHNTILTYYLQKKIKKLSNQMTLHRNAPRSPLAKNAIPSGKSRAGEEPLALGLWWSKRGEYY